MGGGATHRHQMAQWALMLMMLNEYSLLRRLGESEPEQNWLGYEKAW
jgi:hypothetical protein